MDFADIVQFAKFGILLESFVTISVCGRFAVWFGNQLSKTKRHPLLLGEYLDNQVKEYVKSLRDAGAVSNQLCSCGGCS